MRLLELYCIRFYRYKERTRTSVTIRVCKCIGNSSNTNREPITWCVATCSSKRSTTSRIIFWFAPTYHFSTLSWIYCLSNIARTWSLCKRRFISRWHYYSSRFSIDCIISTTQTWFKAIFCYIISSIVNSIPKRLPYLIRC